MNWNKCNGNRHNMFKILNGRMQTSEIFTSVEVQLNSGLLITIPAIYWVMTTCMQTVCLKAQYQTARTKRECKEKLNGEKSLRFTSPPRLTSLTIHFYYTAFWLKALGKSIELRQSLTTKVSSTTFMLLNFVNLLSCFCSCRYSTLSVQIDVAGQLRMWLKHSFALLHCVWFLL